MHIEKVLADMTTDGTKAVFDVLKERKRQDEKWGEQNHDPFLYLTILGEEYGEACQAALHAKFNGESIGSYREELVQTCAVALAMIQCLDRQKWQWSTSPGTDPANLVQ